MQHNMVFSTFYGIQHAVYANLHLLCSSDILVTITKTKSKRGDTTEPSDRCDHLSIDRPLPLPGECSRTTSGNAWDRLILPVQNLCVIVNNINGHFCFKFNFV